MRTLLTCMTAACALAAAAPAAAQYGSFNSGGTAAFDSRLAQIESRIQAGINAGAITRREAFSLRANTRNVRRLYYAYARNGLTQRERVDLRARIRNLNQEIQIADGRRFDNRYGQGGPYEPVCVDRGGVGGLIADLFGDDYDCDDYGFRVGQRVTGNLGVVPSGYGYSYRDGNGVYYSSDGRNIYQIDARTNTVLRVYDIDR